MISNMNLTASSATICPLVLKHVEGDQVVWELRFQSFPVSKIILEGRKPTLEEMVGCLTYLSFPVAIIPLLMIIADIAEPVRGENMNALLDNASFSTGTQ